MKIAIILGTRPEIIKMSSIIKELTSRKIDFFILHTGQHYDYAMDGQFFSDLELPKPKYNLGVGGSEYRKQVGLMIREIQNILAKEKPDVILVQGDTNTVLAGAQAANKLGIKIGHHEAGLRSHDLTMLEETNRIITDHISDYLFAPTEDALKNLLEEGIDKGKVFLTGNTAVDAVLNNLEISKNKYDLAGRLELKKYSYILATAHRAENVDLPEKLKGIINGLDLAARELKLEVILPIHPRTANNIKKFGLTIPETIRVIDPVGYLEFLQLAAMARLIITDSGGLQEEACVLKVPCVTIRENTERPETIKAGVNVLAGTDPEKILAYSKKMVNSRLAWINPFGDGQAGKRIVDFLEKIKK